MGGKQGDLNENLQLFETLPTTEEPRPAPPPMFEDHYPIHEVSQSVRIMDEMQTYNKLRKLLDNK